MLFTVHFSEGGVGRTLLSPTITIWEITEATPPTEIEVITGAAMTEIGGGFYSYPYTADNTKTYTANADGGAALATSERYAPCISTVQGEVGDIQSTVDDIEVDTGTDIPASFVATDGKIDAVQSTVDDIEVDTGTDIPASFVATDGLITTMQVDVTFIRGIEGGRWKIDKTVDPHQMLFYNEAGALIKTFDLTQASTEIPQYEERTIV